MDDSDDEQHLIPMDEETDDLTLKRQAVENQITDFYNRIISIPDPKNNAEAFTEVLNFYGMTEDETMEHEAEFGPV